MQFSDAFKVVPVDNAVYPFAVVTVAGDDPIPGVDEREAQRVCDAYNVEAQANRAREWMRSA